MNIKKENHKAFLIYIHVLKYFKYLYIKLKLKIT
jgi:hypothetical protein